MYIRRLEIKNIRSISHFEMTFPEGREAGWHVLIGDNGSGKSTIIRSLALAMLDVVDVNAARQDWNDWLQSGQSEGSVDVLVIPDIKDSVVRNRIALATEILVDDNDEVILGHNEAVLQEIIFRNTPSYDVKYSDIHRTSYMNQPQAATKTRAWFSVAYGPFRRFTGGSQEKELLYKSNPNLGAHLSAFGEDVALTEALTYLSELYIRQIEAIVKQKTEAPTLDYLIQFINQAELLPHGARISSIDPYGGVWFQNGNGVEVDATKLSDGYRSVLSMTFDIIRNLIRSYGADAVFKTVREGGKTIDLPGVVMIDEVDAHLHPTWQTRIGQWFTTHFPNLQFIVTTHSPLVCRAAEKGSIWRLAAPGSDQKSGEVTGLDRDRLIFGNVLDAYGTEVFGQDVERSEESKEKLQRLAHLSQLSSYGKISEEEKQEMQELRKILITDDTTEF